MRSVFGQYHEKGPFAWFCVPTNGGSWKPLIYEPFLATTGSWGVLCILAGLYMSIFQTTALSMYLLLGKNILAGRVVAASRFGIAVKLWAKECQLTLGAFFLRFGGCGRWECAVIMCCCFWIFLVKGGNGCRGHFNLRSLELEFRRC